jgi:predicted dehydrogenase
MTRTRIRFGIIGLGLMGREFASAAARWLHLTHGGAQPVITAVCDTNPAALDWFRERVPSVELATTDYRELLGEDTVEAVYCAVPHNLHRELYVAIIEAGKHLLGEKPFGIDLEANRMINEAIREHPGVLVRCSSEMPFFPGAQRIVEAIRDRAFGRIIDVEAGFLHSSDLNPDKPINWKRMVRTNGAYGVMGDLGLHALHIPLRFGWVPRGISAQLSNIVTERPDGKGGRVPCETWDNAMISGEVEADAGNFPILVRTKRIAPGEANTWYLKVHGTDRSMEFSTKQPKTLRLLEYVRGGSQAWQHIDVGYESAYPTITGPIFEFGFSDAILQMWAAFCDELANGREGMRQQFHCATPEEATLSHEIFTAALESYGRGADGRP